jgi:hypothetical protein
MDRITLIFSSDEQAVVLHLFEAAFRSTPLNVQTLTVPSTWMFDSAYVRRLRSLINEARLDSFTVVHPPAELFLPEADLLVTFSAYRSWYNSARMRVIPHLWTPIGFLDHTKELAWSAKPPLTVGFMGRTFRASAVAKLMRSTPIAVKKWLLSGPLVRNASFAAVL